MNPELTEQIMAILVPAAVTTVGALASWGLLELKRFIRTRTQNEALMNAMDQISEITMSVVQEIEQAVRKKIGDRKLTPEEAKQVKALAVKTIRKQIPRSVEVATKAGMNSLDDFLKGKVEESVKLSKGLRGN